MTTSISKQNNQNPPIGYAVYQQNIIQQPVQMGPPLYQNPNNVQIPNQPNIAFINGQYPSAPRNIGYAVQPGTVIQGRPVNNNRFIIQTNQVEVDPEQLKQQYNGCMYCTSLVISIIMLMIGLGTFIGGCTRKEGFEIVNGLISMSVCCLTLYCLHCSYDNWLYWSKWLKYCMIFIGVAYAILLIVIIALACTVNNNHKDDDNTMSAELSIGVAFILAISFGLLCAELCSAMNLYPPIVVAAIPPENSSREMIPQGIPIGTYQLPPTNPAQYPISNLPPQNPYAVSVVPPIEAENLQQ